MKKIFLLLVSCLILGNMTTYAQLTKEQIKERKELMKFSKAQLNEKATKDARKEAKKLEKEGWSVAPGALPLVKQLDRSYLMQMDFDPETMFPKYIIGDAMSIGENYDAAKMQATELALQNVAAKTQSEIVTLVESKVGNKQLSADEAASVTQSVMGAKNLIAQNLGQTTPMMECYRTLKNKNKEVRIQVGYNSEMAKAAAKKAIRDDLEKLADDIQKKLDATLGW